MYARMFSVVQDQMRLNVSEGILINLTLIGQADCAIIDP